MTEPAQVVTRYRERRHDLVIFVWAPDYSDPSSTIEFFSLNRDNSDNSTNKNAPWRNRWLIPELTTKMEAARNEVNPKARLDRYAEVQRTLRDDSPFVFMLQKVEPIAMRSNVKGYNGAITFDSTLFNLITK